jgi:hypothetical protein
MLTPYVQQTTILQTDASDGYFDPSEAIHGYERAAGGNGSVPLRRVLGANGHQAREGGSRKQRTGASHLRLFRVWP